MSTSFYTSYETSLALREAGAEQRPHDVVMTWDTDGGDEPVLMDSLCSEADSPRAFRLDEILEALIAVGPLRVHGGSDGWYVYLCDEADEHRSAMPVEAAAACWLAVLRAAREARP